MEPNQITDRTSFEAWLNARPKATRQRDAVWLASRTAARVFPLYGFWTQKIGKLRTERQAVLTALPVLRALLTSAVAAVSPSPGLKAAAKTASRSADIAAAAVFVSARHRGGGINHSAAIAASHAAATVNLTATATIRANNAASSAMKSITVDTYANVWKQIRNIFRGEFGYDYEQIRNDAALIDSFKEQSHAPLWSAEPPHWFTQADAKTREIWQADPPGTWDYWLRWWQHLIDGAAQDWALQERVALIPDGFWNAGPEAVAAEIARQEDFQGLLQQVSEMRRKLDQAAAAPSTASATPSQRGHNHPPELVDMPVDLRRQITTLTKVLQEAELELAKQSPSPSMLARIGHILIEAAKAITLYCAGLGDVALKKSAEVIGETGTKAAIYVVAVNYAPQVGALGKVLLELAAKLASGG